MMHFFLSIGKMRHVISFERYHHHEGRRHDGRNTNANEASSRKRSSSSSSFLEKTTTPRRPKKRRFFCVKEEDDTNTHTISDSAQHPLKGDDDDDGALDTKNDALLLDRMKIAVQSATARPTQKHVVDALKDLASQEFGLANVKFTEVMQKIDELYDHNPQFGYSSGVGTEGGFKRR